MTFSKRRGKAGQAFLETLLGITALSMISLVGVVILLQGVGTLICIKWAAENSLCIAKQASANSCSSATTLALQKYFALKKIQVSSKIVRGIIHSNIQAMIAGHAVIQGSYDLGPSEYKRVSK